VTLPAKCGLCDECCQPPGIGGASFCYHPAVKRRAELAYQPPEVSRREPPPPWCPLRCEPRLVERHGAVCNTPTDAPTGNGEAPCARPFGHDGMCRAGR